MSIEPSSRNMPHGDASPMASGRAVRSEVAYQRIRSLIDDNTWPPGHQVLERELTALLGMSRTPVREAMVRLENDDLIEIIPRHGFKVQALSARLMQEVYQVLGALEVCVAEIVAADPDRHAGLQELAAHTDAMTQALDDADLPAWAQADDAFHAHLVAMSKNTVLIDTVARFRDRVRRARLMTLRLRPPPAESTQEHRALVAALAAGRIQLAADLHRAHRVRGAAELIPILESFQAQSEPM